MPLLDYSAWLTPERLAVEEAAWGQARFEDTYAPMVLDLCARTGITTLIEHGCGTGRVAARLPNDYRYVGIDSNPQCILRARERAPEKLFICADARTFTQRSALFSLDEEHICYAFSFYKHFSVEELPRLLTGHLSLAAYSLFSLPIAVWDVDDGTEFHHTWLSPDTLLGSVENAGHEIYLEQMLWHSENWLRSERVFWTRKKAEGVNGLPGREGLPAVWRGGAAL